MGLVVQVQVEVVVSVMTFSTVACTVVLSVRVLTTVAVTVAVAVFTVTFRVTVVVGTDVGQSPVWVTVRAVKVKIVVLQTTACIFGQHLFPRAGRSVGTELSSSRLLRCRGI
jgi:hypothetical protein